MLFLIKSLISGFLIAGASVLVRKYPGPAGILVALPMTTFLSLAWMRFDGVKNPEIATFLQSVGWITLGGVGLFFLTPYLLRIGWGFWPSFLLGTLSLTVGSFVVFKLGS